MRIGTFIKREVVVTVKCRLLDAESRPSPWSANTFVPDTLEVQYRSRMAPVVMLHGQTPQGRRISEPVSVDRYPSLSRSAQAFILQHQPEEGELT